MQLFTIFSINCIIFSLWAQTLLHGFMAPCLLSSVDNKVPQLLTTKSKLIDKRQTERLAFCFACWCMGLLMAKKWIEFTTDGCPANCLDELAKLCLLLQSNSVTILEACDSVLLIKQPKESLKSKSRFHKSQISRMFSEI